MPHDHLVIRMRTLWTCRYHNHFDIICSRILITGTPPKSPSNLPARNGCPCPHQAAAELKSVEVIRVEALHILTYEPAVPLHGGGEQSQIPRHLVVALPDGSVHVVHLHAARADESIASPVHEGEEVVRKPAAELPGKPVPVDDHVGAVREAVGENPGVARVQWSGGAKVGQERVRLECADELA